MSGWEIHRQRDAAKIPGRQLGGGRRAPGLWHEGEDRRRAGRPLEELSGDRARRGRLRPHRPGGRGQGRHFRSATRRTMARRRWRITRSPLMLGRSPARHSGLFTTGCGRDSGGPVLDAAAGLPPPWRALRGRRIGIAGSAGSAPRDRPARQGVREMEVVAYDPYLPQRPGDRARRERGSTSAASRRSDRVDDGQPAPRPADAGGNPRNDRRPGLPA